MSEVVLSSSTHPRNPIQNAPRMIIYDPDKHIKDPVVQLAPFGSFAEVYYDKGRLIHQIGNVQDQRLFLLLIFSSDNALQVRRFWMKYIRDQGCLHSLFLIFHNGMKSHDEYINTQTIPKLRWCRSFTFELFEYIREACQSACDESISYFDQQMTSAVDAITRDSPDAAQSLAVMFANEKKKFVLLASSYLSTYP